jgi:hypothetical protein
MKTFAIVLSAFLLLAGAAPMALAQDSSSSSSSAPQAAPGGSASGSASGSVSVPADKAPDVNVKTPDAKVGIDVNRNDGGSASPRTETVTRTTFFGLSPTAAIIVSVAVLLVVVLAIVAMTNSGGSTTYIDKGDRRL